MTQVAGQEIDNYPFVMTHPNARKGVIHEFGAADRNGQVVKGFSGEPDVFPPMTVATAGQEESARALGYRMPGETPEQVGFAEYPKCLRHPDHRPEQLEVRPVVDSQNNVLIPGRPGTPAHMPDVFAATPREQAAWEAKGYLEPGKGDPEAALRSMSGIDLDYEPDSDGEPVLHERTSSGLPSYPMMVGDRVVHTRAEHEALIGRSAMPDALEVARQKREAARRKLAEAQAALDEADAELGASIDPKPPAAPVAEPGKTQEALDDAVLRELLFEDAAARGVRIDRRWATARIEKALAAAASAGR